MGTSPEISMAIFMFLKTGGQNWTGDEILSFWITFKSWFVSTYSPYRAKQRNCISIYSFYLHTCLSCSCVFSQYHNLMYTMCIIWWCIFSLLYKDNHESHTSPMPLVFGLLYYTSQTEPVYMDHSCFCKHAPVSQMYQQRAEKCKCGKNTKTNKQWVKKEAQRSQEPCLLATGHCAWLLHKQPVTSRTMSTSHRTLHTATAWPACHLKNHVN